MLRALVTAVGALRRAGVPSPPGTCSWSRADSGNFTALLVKKTPSPAKRGAGPRLGGRQPLLPRLRRARAQRAAGRTCTRPSWPWASPGRSRRSCAAYPFDVSPATDDRPFFFKYSYWWHLLPRDPPSRPGRSWSEPRPPAPARSALAAIACVYLPLRFLAAADRRGPPRGGTALYFAAIGVGYMAVEIALLQKFGLFLGHPNYALSVVLAALLLSTGLGALASARLPGARAASGSPPTRSAVLILAPTFALPLLPRLVGLPSPPAGLVFALLAPGGPAARDLHALGARAPEGRPRRPSRPGPGGSTGSSPCSPRWSASAFAVTWGSGRSLLAAIPVYLVAGKMLFAPS